MMTKKKDEVELTNYNVDNKELYSMPGRYVLYVETSKNTFMQLFASNNLDEVKEQMYEEAIESAKKAYIEDRKSYDGKWLEIFDPNEGE